MTTETTAVPVASTAAKWIGRLVSLAPSALLVMSGVMKLQQPPEVLKGFTELGYPVEILTGLGIVELACVAIYWLPPTNVLGAILLTGYLGGAVSAHVRHGDPWGPCLTPVVLGLFLWLGLVIRDPRLRKLVPIRTN